MRRISKERLKELERDVQKGFPKNYGLQQVHLARLILQEKTKGMTPEQFVRYVKARAKKVLGQR